MELVFVLFQHITRAPREIRKHTAENDRPNVRVPSVGSIKLNVDVAQAVAPQYECLVTEGTRRIHRRFNFASYLEEIVGIAQFVTIALI
jgi:hypothetical protein